ncbi:regulator of microtubule dynamics protein 1 isoform X1 [Lethenteron reissneri]|uniref:regulator of microtubule dynamics protein 1 isoform X1 n=1 Tax=Lethenteron reissneri TaxID=7753 RepID=UPI002AB76192|nr:regulator of microtubule dynamics protein 1 isoform X1 [Lethenteron reissneri]
MSWRSLVSRCCRGPAGGGGGARLVARAAETLRRRPAPGAARRFEGSVPTAATCRVWATPAGAAAAAGLSRLCGSPGVVRGLRWALLGGVAGWAGVQMWRPPLAAAQATSGSDYALEKLIEQADYLYGTLESEKLYLLLKEQADRLDSDEVLWRLARAARDLAQRSGTTTEERRRLTYEALDAAKRALSKNPSSFACHKWYAICVSDVGDFEGIKVKIANAFVIKEHFQKAIELNPRDPTSLHLMGLWCFTFAEMPWYQRRIAAVLFASPPSATFYEALEYFSEAEQVEPSFYSKNLLMLGKTQLRLGNVRGALLWLTKARDFPARTDEDAQVQKEAC